MNTVFTLLCYREDGADSCRGHVNERSSSAFEHFISTDKEEVARKWGEKLFDSSTAGRAFCSWEMTLLINGADSHNWDQCLGAPDGEADDPGFGEIEARARAEFERLTALRDAQTQQAAAAALAKQERERIQALRAERERDLAELARLQKLFPGQAGR